MKHPRKPSAPVAESHNPGFITKTNTERIILFPKIGSKVKVIRQTAFGCNLKTDSQHFDRNLIC
jgi:hypothetical protein